MVELHEKDLVFALDIGTRSVIGIVGYQNDDVFLVCATGEEMYKHRVVVDGQIEDIEKTAVTAESVKKHLEEKLGITLKNVHIAAAGRTLRTVETSAEASIEDEIIDEKFIKRLEFSAIEKAYGEIGNDSEETFYCVGSAVQNYVLDGYEISTLLNHKGKKAQVNMIATFLPKEVVETLYTTMRRIGLTVSSLTLEPIAAMNALIPPELRKLNLTLCDIGAGTADIAICRDGSVSGYTMATVAGDEITEAVMQTCLVDFDTAEEIKFKMSEFLENTPETVIEYMDILGIPHEEAVISIFDRIKSVVEHLAQVICERVLDINGKAPAAMFLVGGGSQTPCLKQLVAKGLDMDINKVAVGSNVYMKKLAESEENIFVPQYATPLGIALTAGMKNADTFSISVNGEKTRLFNTWDTTVLGVLQMSGYRYSQIMGQSGHNMMYKLNGVQKTARGGIPTPSVITVNGAEAQLSQVVLPGDTITFEPAKNGNDACVTVGDIIDGGKNFSVILNGEPYSVGTIVEINGILVHFNSSINNGDDVIIKTINTLDDLLENIGGYMVIDGVLVNGTDEPLDYILKEGDVIDTIFGSKPIDTKNIVKEPIPVPVKDIQSINIQQATSINVLLNDSPLELKPKKDGTAYQFFDLLAFMDIDPKNPQGNIVQVLNGAPASYIAELKDGDQAEIYWGK